MKPRVLIIDDSAVILDVARWALEKAGYEVHTSDNPLSAASAIRRLAPDLVLLDVNMPTLRGDVVAEVLERNELTGKSPVLLHSDIAVAELERLVQKTGARGYIRKTGDFEQLAREVGVWLEKTRAAQRG